MGRTPNPNRVELRMSRLHSGIYELHVGKYHFEMYSEASDQDGAYGKPKTVTEWYGSINGHVVVHGKNTQEIKIFLKPLVDKAHEVLRLDRRREQGALLLTEIFKISNPDELPDNVKAALAEYGSEAADDIDQLLHTHMNDQPDESDEEDEDEPEGPEDETFVRSL
jgi:hypothetical protein